MVDDPRLMSLEEPTPEPAADPAVEAEHDDAEPEGVIEVNGRRVVDVSTLAAERKRVRAVAEKRIRDTELAPLQAKAQEADQLRQALAAAQPYVQLVQQHPELTAPKKPTPDEERISDDEAANYARQYELYSADGQPDVRRAKRMLADNDRRMTQIAATVAQQAVGPVQAATADERSKMNFARMAQLQDSDGHTLVDPKVLAEEWVKLPSELTQHPQVAETVLNAAIGAMMRSGRRPSPAAREPLFSEPAGGRSAGRFQLTTLDRKLGLTEKDGKDIQTRFVPGGISQIGD